ncbi:unnamed protein product [Prorocentrum cordatum]|uniref:Uncharacterized protein n=1 Tax=Prorocentrum cordatum TaxID=2364126 RepID=A0ABN9UHW1_9DINO|nr:unnamed protein product [Polarella glacialis]
MRHARERGDLEAELGCGARLGVASGRARMDDHLGEIYDRTPVGKLTLALAHAPRILEPCSALAALHAGPQTSRWVVQRWYHAAFPPIHSGKEVAGWDSDDKAADSCQGSAHLSTSTPGGACGAGLQLSGATFEGDHGDVDPERARELKAQGNELFKAGKVHDAREAYSEAIYLTPLADSADRAVLYSNRAACMQKLGRWEDVVSDCKLAVELDPTYVKAWARRSAAYEALEKWHDSLEDLKKAIELDPSLRSREYRRQAMLETRAQQQFEKDKDEMMGKLKASQHQLVLAEQELRADGELLVLTETDIRTMLGRRTSIRKRFKLMFIFWQGLISGVHFTSLKEGLRNIFKLVGHGADNFPGIPIR